MRIYLVQHGKAMSKDEHPDRPLSEDGKADVERMARFLGRTNLNLQNIFHVVCLQQAEDAGCQVEWMVTPAII